MGTPASAIQVRPMLAQIVAPEVFVPELGHHLVPRGGITQHRRRDPPAPGSGEQPRIAAAVRRRNPPQDQIVELLDQRHGSRALFFGALVHQPTGSSGRLPAHGPGPLGLVDVLDPAARDFWRS